MLVIDDPEQCLHGLQLVVGRLSLDQLDDRAAQTPYIRRRSGAREFNDLWSHPIRRANDTRLVQARLLCSDAEVGQFNKAFLCSQDIGALDIPVYDTLLVEVQETVEDLGHVKGDEVFRKLAEVLADAVQRAVLAIPGHVSSRKCMYI